MNKWMKKLTAALCAAQTVKKYASMMFNRAAGELEGARPASNWINRRRKPCYIKAFGNSILNAFKMLGGKRGQKCPHRTFLTSCAHHLLLKEKVVQSVKEHSVKLSRNGIIYATVEKTSKKAEKVRAIPVPCC